MKHKVRKKKINNFNNTMTIIVFKLIIYLLFNILICDIIVLVNIEQEFYYIESLNTIKCHGRYGMIYKF